METLHLARAKYLLDQVSNNVKYVTLDGSPALPSGAAELIECLGKLGLVEAADAMRKDFIVYFAHETRLPNTGLDPRLVEFRSKANELFGPFLKYSRPKGDSTVVRLRLIDQFDGLRITFKKLSMLSSPLTLEPGTEPDDGKPGTTTQAQQAQKQGEYVSKQELDAVAGNYVAFKTIQNNNPGLTADNTGSNGRSLYSYLGIRARYVAHDSSLAKILPETFSEFRAALQSVQSG